MLLTISTTMQPATDLGFLLHKNPARAHHLIWGRAGGEAGGVMPPASDLTCFGYGRKLGESSITTEIPATSLIFRAFVTKELHPAASAVERCIASGSRSEDTERRRADSIRISRETGTTVKASEFFSALRYIS